MIYTTYMMMMMMSLCLEAAKKKVQWFPLFNSEHAKKKLVGLSKAKVKSKMSRFRYSRNVKCSNPGIFFSTLPPCQFSFGNGDFNARLRLI